MYGTKKVRWWFACLSCVFFCGLRRSFRSRFLLPLPNCLLEPGYPEWKRQILKHYPTDKNSKIVSQLSFPGIEQNHLGYFWRCMDGHCVTIFEHARKEFEGSKCWRDVDKHPQNKPVSHQWRINDYKDHGHDFICKSNGCKCKEAHHPVYQETSMTKSNSKVNLHCQRN